MLTWFVMVLALGLVFGSDAAFAKGDGEGGGKGKGKMKMKRKGKDKTEAVQPASISESMTVGGKIVVDGEVVKLVADDGKEYMLAASTALANKEKNGQKATISGTVTEIEGKKWISADTTGSSDAGKAGGGEGAGKGGKSGGGGGSGKGKQ